MKQLLIILTAAALTGCWMDNTLEVTADGLGCNECLVRDSVGNIVSMDTTSLQNFLLPGWCESLAEWGQVCDCCLARDRSTTLRVVPVRGGVAFTAR